MVCCALLSSFTVPPEQIHRRIHLKDELAVDLQEVTSKELLPEGASKMFRHAATKVANDLNQDKEPTGERRAFLYFRLSRGTIRHILKLKRFNIDMISIIFFFEILSDLSQAVPNHQKMVRWCIRLTRLTLVCEVIRYRLVQVRQNLKKRLFGLAARNRLSLFLPLSFSSSSYFLSFLKQK